MKDMATYPKTSLRSMMQELLVLLGNCDRDVELTKSKSIELKNRLFSPRTIYKVKLETLLVCMTIIKTCDEL